LFLDQPPYLELPVMKNVIFFEIYHTPFLPSKKTFRFLDLLRPQVAADIWTCKPSWHVSKHSVTLPAYENCLKGSVSVLLLYEKFIDHTEL